MLRHEPLGNCLPVHLTCAHDGLIVQKTKQIIHLVVKSQNISLENENPHIGFTHQQYPLVTGQLHPVEGPLYSVGIISNVHHPNEKKNF